MKIFKNTLAVLAFASLLIVMSCDNKGPGIQPDPPGQQRAEELEAGGAAWAPSVVSNDGDPRSEWSGFTLRFTANADFTGGSYTTSGGPSEDDAALVWPASGNWSFATNSDGSLNLGSIIRDDGVEMDVVVSVTTDGDNNVTGGSLNLQFTIDDPSARTAGFFGPWEFTFSI